MMRPGSPLSRMSLVAEILSASLKRVMTRRSVGKTENSKGSLVYMVRSIMPMEILKLAAIRRSSMYQGKGTTNMATMSTTNIGTSRSVILLIRPFSP